MYIMGEMSFGEFLGLETERTTRSAPTFVHKLRAVTLQEHRYHWSDAIVKATYMNDVMRAVVCIPGLFSVLEWFPPIHSQRTLYRHGEYATEHTEAYVFFLHLISRKRIL